METDKLATENQELRQWIKELEAFLKEYLAHVHPRSKVGQQKQRLLAKRPKLLPRRSAGD